jgi:hypothetical protein
MSHPVWISNQAMVADAMEKVLAEKDLIYKIQYMITNIDKIETILTFKRGDNVSNFYLLHTIPATMFLEASLLFFYMLTCL